MRNPILNRMPWLGVEGKRPEQLLDREWLVTNGLGGYASGSVSGACTRRYHGLLIAALPVPLGRTMMFNHLAEELRLPGGKLVPLGGEERPDGSVELHGEAFLAEFRLEAGLPVWRYELDQVVIEKNILLPYEQNTVYITYRVLKSPERVRLRLRPSLHFRPHDAPVSGDLDKPYKVVGTSNQFEIHSSEFPPLRVRIEAAGAALVLDGGRTREIFYRVEAGRGYESRGRLWSPGYFRTDLAEGESATLVASTEDWDTVLAISSAEAHTADLERRARLIAQASTHAQQGPAAELVLAADQFIIKPTRTADAVRAHASGDEVRTVIAGYHWFTDWGRDTMISLEGLTLNTGRHAEAGWVLRTFSNYVRNGLIPNLFPEGQREGLYHTADATLWYFHAIDRYLAATQDRVTLRLLLPILQDIVAWHLRGADFGIGVDPNDGLLRQGQEGYQLTWMDAKVDGWVVTPRRGKAVEINALWYNALRLLEHWLREENNERSADEISGHARRARESFNRRFWNPQKRYLYDVVDGEMGDDASCRPNQIFAISLPHPVLEHDYWKPVLDTATERLLTPMGLRTLAPGEPEYKPRYDGDLRSRDAAYHQGTVWAWLMGPFVDAWMKVYPDGHKTAQDLLAGFVPHLGEACMGSISEIFDAEAPYTPRGCVAQAWSVAEVLRSWVKVAEAAKPSPLTGV